MAEETEVETQTEEPNAETPTEDTAGFPFDLNSPGDDSDNIPETTDSEPEATDSSEETDANEEDSSTSDTDATEESSTSEVPFHEHPRFKEVIKEREDARKELEELRGKVDRLKEPEPSNVEDTFFENYPDPSRDRKGYETWFEGARDKMAQDFPRSIQEMTFPAIRVAMDLVEEKILKHLSGKEMQSQEEVWREKNSDFLTQLPESETESLMKMLDGLNPSEDKLFEVADQLVDLYKSKNHGVKADAVDAKSKDLLKKAMDSNDVGASPTGIKMPERNEGESYGDYLTRAHRVLSEQGEV